MHHRNRSIRLFIVEACEYIIQCSALQTGTAACAWGALPKSDLAAWLSLPLFWTDTFSSIPPALGPVFTGARSNICAVIEGTGTPLRSTSPRNYCCLTRKLREGCGVWSRPSSDLRERAGFPNRPLCWHIICWFSSMKLLKMGLGRIATETRAEGLASCGIHGVIRRIFTPRRTEMPYPHAHRVPAALNTRGEGRFDMQLTCLTFRNRGRSLGRLLHLTESRSP